MASVYDDKTIGAGERWTGRCLCGSVAFEFQGPVRPFTACHCRTCRRQTGHFVVATSIPTEQFEFHNREGLSWYSSSHFAERGFCSRCGSVLFYRMKDRSSIEVFAGALDDPAGIPVSHHIFAGEKGCYYELTDGLPAFAGDDTDR